MKIFERLKLKQKFVVYLLFAPILLLISIMYFSARNEVMKMNEQMRTNSVSISQAVLNKVDRNFYERYGDVQAFAVNELAVTALQKRDSVISKLQKFVNTMVTYYVVYDIMMLADRDGKVILVNTVDKDNNSLSTNFIVGKNVKSEDWFRICSVTIPEGGAWYSDFTKSTESALIYGTDGWGMAFAAPVLDENQNIIGVWYNFANWNSITSGIRIENESVLQETDKSAHIIITNSDGLIIDCEAENLINQATLVNSDFENPDAYISFEDESIRLRDYNYGWGKAVGAYTYKGHNWRAVTILEKVKLSIYTFINNENIVSLMTVSLIILIICAVISIVYSNKLTNRILNIVKNVEHISNGEIVEMKDIVGTDEIASMEKSVKKLAENQNKIAHFAAEIGKGNLSVDYQPLGLNDILGNSLINMQHSLKVAEDEDNKRKIEDEKNLWSTSGFAKFGEILRNNNNDIAILSNQIIAEMVLYTNCNQGALYMLNTNDFQETFLEMIACYAWEKKKHFLDKKISLGEDLTGQCVLDKKTIILTDVPENYIIIKSGLGGANPRIVIIVPLMINEEVYGIIELASFNMLDKYIIEFVEKIGESIASSIASVKVNIRTALLLKQSQEQTQQLKQQEEEIRQNMEELSASQEEMHKREEELVSFIDAVKTAYFTVEYDLKGKVINVNSLYSNFLGVRTNEMIGLFHAECPDIKNNDIPQYDKFWEDLRNGSKKNLKIKVKTKQGNEILLYETYIPVEDEDNQIKKILKLSNFYEA